MSPRALAAPMHRHLREDEYSYVLEGRMGRCSATRCSRPARRPRLQAPRQWHTFWNAGDEPCRILEIIAPAGFERFFAELVDLGGVPSRPAALGDLCERYGLEMSPTASPTSSSASASASPARRPRDALATARRLRALVDRYRRGGRQGHPGLAGRRGPALGLPVIRSAPIARFFTGQGTRR